MGMMKWPLKKAASSTVQSSPLVNLSSTDQSTIGFFKFQGSSDDSSDLYPLAHLQLRVRRAVSWIFQNQHLTQDTSLFPTSAALSWCWSKAVTSLLLTLNATFAPSSTFSIGVFLDGVGVGRVSTPASTSTVPSENVGSVLLQSCWREALHALSLVWSTTWMCSDVACMCP